MKPPRSVKPLPRYTRRKPLTGGRWGYFFEPPTWARRTNCPVDAEPLGQDYDLAVRRAEDVLLKAFDSWRTGGLSDMVPIGPSIGTFDWLVSIFKGHLAWKEIDRKTQRLYEQGFKLFADHILKDGSRAGSKKLRDFNRGFVDAVYARLLVIEATDPQGNVVTRTRRRFANAAMIACRRAWNIGKRAEEKIVPEVNPFANMGLKKRGPGDKPRETPTATWEELSAFRAKARELGYVSIGTAALAAWEWLQREEHLLGAFLLSHYRPAERPNAVRVVHPKNGEEAWWPLFDERQQHPDEHPLFPELMAELNAIKDRSVVGIDALIFRRDHAHRRGKVPLPWITPRGDLDHFRSVVKHIIRAAGLRDELSFASFRHGGFTEGADADITDAELRAAGRPPFRTAASDLRQTHSEATHLGRSEAARGKNKNNQSVKVSAVRVQPTDLKMHPLESLPDSLRMAFDEGNDQMSFGIREKEYLFVVDYDELPFVKGMLFVAGDEPEIWIPIADSGDEYVGDDPPEPWKALPDFMAEKIAWAANMHVLSIEQ